MKHRGVAALLSMAMLAAACGSGESATDAASAESSSTTTEAVATTEAAPATDAPTVAEIDEAEPETSTGPAEFNADAELIEGQFVPIDPGEYLVETIGTPFSFTTTERMMVQPNGDSFFVLADATNQGPDDQDLVFQRISAFSMPSNPAGSTEEQGDGWPATDVEGWLDAVEGIEISNRENTTVSGLDAVKFDAKLADGFTCGQEFCAGFATNRLVTGLSFNPRASYRVWVIDQGEESPILMHAAIQRDSQIEWFDAVDKVVSTLAFGPSASNPIPAEGDLWELGFASDVPAGVVELPALGGIRFELSTDRFIVQNDDEHHFITSDGPASSELLIIDRDAGEAPLATVDDLIAAVTFSSTSATEIEATTLGGFPARVFDMETDGSNFAPSLLPLNGVAGQAGWSAPLSGRLWVAETDRGLVMVTAEIFEPSADLNEMIAQSELIVATLEFIDG